MNTIELLRINLHVAHDSFSKTVADVTQEMADWVPPGIAHPLGERYAHAVAAEDWLVHGIAQGQTPWFASTWAGRTGFGSIDFRASNEALRAFRVDISALREYEMAVFASSAARLNSLTEIDMDRVIDMSSLGYGQVPAPAWWSSFIIGHLHDLMGEISILKGCLGMRGYPF